MLGSLFGPVTTAHLPVLMSPRVRIDLSTFSLCNKVDAARTDQRRYRLAAEESFFRGLIDNTAG